MLHVPTDDKFLLRFLRAKKFDHERAMECIHNMYRMRVANQELFKTMRPSAVRPGLDAGVFTVLPGRDKEGRRILVTRTGMLNCSKQEQAY